MRARRSIATGLVLVASAAAVGSLLTPAQAAVATVDVVNNAYNPTPVTIVAGDSVNWTFTGTSPHSVTADPGQPITFDSHPTCGTSGGTCSTPGQSFTTTFTSAGTYRYFCKIHGGPGGAGMSGVVTVNAAPASAAPTPTTTPAASPTPAATPTPTTTHPPSPAPTASPTAGAAAPTLNAPTTAVAGVVVSVSGTASPGALVELFRVTAPNATLLKVNETTADSAGNWVRTIRPLRNVNLQARSGGQVSPTRFIAVRTAVRQSVAALSGCVVQVSGSVFEPKPGRTVFLRAVDSAGRTVSLGTGTVQSDGRFLLRRPYPCGQTLRVYAVIEGDAVNRPGSTDTQTVTTRR